MSSLGKETGIGTYHSLRAKVRDGILRCKQNSAMYCGNCPYTFLKHEDGNTDDCTTVLLADTYEYIKSIGGWKEKL